MNKPLLVASLLLLGAGTTLALAPSAADAANADNPYGNIDHSNDLGNDTGDSQVEGLNAQQLNRNYTGPLVVHHPDGTATVAPAQPNTAPPGTVPPPQAAIAPPTPPGAVVR